MKKIILTVFIITMAALLYVTAAAAVDIPALSAADGNADGDGIIDDASPDGTANGLQNGIDNGLGDNGALLDGDNPMSDRDKNAANILAIVIATAVAAAVVVVVIMLLPKKDEGRKDGRR